MLPSFSHVFILLLLLLCCVDLSSSLNTKNSTNFEYLKLRLLHKNPPISPSQSLLSDAHRISLLSRKKKSLKTPVVSGASTGSGQYFVDFTVGTPPQKLLLVADTGSDLVWVQCSACRNCSDHQTGSAFFPRHSSTFSPFHCYDRACWNVPHGRKCRRSRLHSPCRYTYSYADQSKTAGFFSRETATMNTSSRREAKLKNLEFGCGFQISGPSVSGGSFNGAHGVMGLGRGPISLASQLGRRFGNKFSYCLLDYTLSPPPASFLLIGGGEAHGPGGSGPVSKKPRMRFTPLLTNPLSPTFYYVGIKSVAVDGVSLPVDPSVWAFDSDGNGGTIIDSGTTLSFFASPAYRLILTAFKRRVKLPLVDDPALGLDLCVNVTGVPSPSLPRLSFRLVGNSVFAPPSGNYFIDPADGVKCLALRAVTPPSSFSVIGNLMQQGFLLEFDRDKSRLGFSRHGCAVK